jgi:hypothetical protein
MLIYEFVPALDVTQSIHDKIYIGMQRGQILNFQNTFNRACDEIRLGIQTRKCLRKSNHWDLLPAPKFAPRIFFYCLCITHLKITREDAITNSSSLQLVLFLFLFNFSCYRLYISFYYCNLQFLNKLRFSSLRHW